MDGFGLPPPPLGLGATAVAPASASPQQQPPPPPGGFGAYQNPVGRPSADPDRNLDRAEQSATVSRMLRNLPKAATDPRIAVYRLKGRSGRHAEPRALMNILMTDVEEAAENEVPPEDYIQERIESELPPGRYLCIPQDNHGNRVKKAAQWEVSTVENRDYDDDEENGRGNDFEEDTPMMIPGMSMPPGVDVPGFANPYNRPPPPANPYPDPESLGQLRDLMREQRSKEESGSSMIMMMLQQQQMNETRLREERETRERERREEERKWREEQRLAEERREERERTAKNDRLQLLAAMAPVFAPLLQKLMDGKEDKITPILLAKLMESDSNRNSAHEMIALMSEASKQQVLLQGEMSRQNMTQQSEANKMMMQHVLTMAQDTISAQRALEHDDEGDPLSKFGKVLSIITPLIQGAQTYTGTPSGYQQAPPQAPQQQIPLQPPQRPAASPPVERHTIQPPQRQPARSDSPNIPDQQWIYGALDTIRRVETGEVSADKRPDALTWCAQNLPQDVQQAILADDQEAVMLRAGGIVMGDEKLKEWITNDATGEIHQQFLLGCLSDIKVILQGLMTEARKAEMVAEQEQYLAQMQAPVRASKQPPPPLGDDEEEEEGLGQVEDDPYGESPDASLLYTAGEDEEDEGSEDTEDTEDTEEGE